MGIHVNIGEAKTRLSELVAAAERGEDVVLSRAGRPVARLIPEERAVAMDRKALVAKRVAAFGKFRDRLVIDRDADLTRPMMTENEMAAWEEDQSRRFLSPPDETAA